MTTTASLEGCHKYEFTDAVTDAKAFDSELTDQEMEDINGCK